MPKKADYRFDDYNYTLIEVLEQGVPFRLLPDFIRGKQPVANVTVEGKSVYCSGRQDDQDITIHFTSRDTILKGTSGKTVEEVVVHVTGSAIYKPIEPEEEA